MHRVTSPSSHRSPAPSFVLDLPYQVVPGPPVDISKMLRRSHLRIYYSTPPPPPRKFGTSPRYLEGPIYVLLSSNPPLQRELGNPPVPLPILVPTNFLPSGRLFSVVCCFRRVRENSTPPRGFRDDDRKKGTPGRRLQHYSSHWLRRLNLFSLAGNGGNPLDPNFSLRFTPKSSDIMSHPTIPTHPSSTQLLLYPLHRLIVLLHCGPAHPFIPSQYHRRKRSFSPIWGFFMHSVGSFPPVFLTIFLY